jgi:hypothetical protein
MKIWNMYNEWKGLQGVGRDKRMQEGQAACRAPFTMKEVAENALDQNAAVHNVRVYERGERAGRAIRSTRRNGIPGQVEGG